MSNFQFNAITDDELKQYSDMAFTFNVYPDEMKKVQVIENKFTTEDLGASAESVDIFVDTVDNKLVNIENFLSKDNFFVRETDSESGAYALGGMIELLESKGVDFQGILIIVRTMSTFIMDRKDISASCSYYSCCPKEAAELLENNPALDGLLAKQRTRLTLNYKEEILKQLDTCQENKTISQFTYDTFKKLLE